MYALPINPMASDRVRFATPGKIARDSHGVVVVPGIIAGFQPLRHALGLAAEPELSRQVR